MPNRYRKEKGARAKLGSVMLDKYRQQKDARASLNQEGTNGEMATMHADTYSTHELRDKHVGTQTNASATSQLDFIEADIVIVDLCN
jgi:hypothetical protein